MNNRSEPDDDEGPGSGAGTVGFGIFFVLAGLSVALMLVSVPLGAIALVASVAAGAFAARHRTAEEGLPGGAVDPESRLEGFIIEPGGGEVDVFGYHDEPRHQSWSDSIATTHRTDELADHTDPAGDTEPVARHDEHRHEHDADRIGEPGHHWADVVDEARHHDDLGSFHQPELPHDASSLFAATDRTDEERERDRARQRAAIESLGPPLLSAEAGGDDEAISHDDEIAELDLDLAGLEPLEEELERDRQVGHLRAVHAEAVEQLNVALARWHQLVGEDADPYDPEPVIRAYDPQLAFDPRQIEASPTVRTVAAYHRSTQARWRVLWASLGAEEVPHPDDVEAVLDAMLADTNGAAEALARLEAAEARHAARRVLERPLVVVEPEAWISAARIDQLLSSLPAETDVVVVERAASGAS